MGKIPTSAPQMQVGSSYSAQLQGRQGSMVSNGAYASMSPKPSASFSLLPGMAPTSAYSQRGLATSSATYQAQPSSTILSSASAMQPFSTQMPSASTMAPASYGSYTTQYGSYATQFGSSKTTQYAQPTIATTQYTQPTAATTQFTQPTAATTQYTQLTAATTQFTQPTAATTQYTQLTAAPTQFTQPTAATTQYTQPTAATTQFTQPTAATTQYTQPTAATTQFTQPTTARVLPSVYPTPPQPAPFVTSVTSMGVPMEASTLTAASTQKSFRNPPPSHEALLQHGRVIEEKVISVEECYGTGLVRSEGEAIARVAPPVPRVGAYEQAQSRQLLTEQVPSQAVPDIMSGPEMIGVVQESSVVVPMVMPMEVPQVQQVAEVAPPMMEEVAPAPEDYRPVAVIVATSGDILGDSHPTGAWLEEIAGPYYVFLEAGCEVHVASTMGGLVPIDQTSLSENFFTENARRFLEEFPEVLENTHAISQISPEQVDCVFVAGGHGTYLDLENQLAQWLTDANVLQKVIGAVCHGPIGLLSAIGLDGQPLIAGKKVAGFTNEEEADVGLDTVVPFLLESKMQELGATIDKGDPWSEHAVRDGNLCTGQNPQSSVQTALLCVEAMREMMLGGEQM